MLDISRYKVNISIMFSKNSFVEWQIFPVRKDYPGWIGIKEYSEFFKGREQI